MCPRTVEPKPDPTPEEYDERIAEIQSKWSEQERENRATVKPKSWSIPIIATPDEIKQGTPPNHYGVPT